MTNSVMIPCRGKTRLKREKEGSSGQTLLFVLVCNPLTLAE